MITTNVVAPPAISSKNQPLNLKKMLKQGILMDRFVHWLRAEDQDKFTRTIRKGIGIGLSIVLCISVVPIPLIVHGVKEWKRQSNSTNSAKLTSNKIEQCATTSPSFAQLASAAPHAMNLIMMNLDKASADSLNCVDTASNRLWYESKLTKMAFEAAKRIEDPFYKAIALCRYAKIDPHFDIDEILTIANGLENNVDRVDLLCLITKIQMLRNQNDALDFMTKALELSNELDGEEHKPNVLLEAAKVSALFDTSLGLDVADKIEDPQLFGIAIYKVSKVMAEVDADFKNAIALSRLIEMPLYRIKALCFIAKSQFESSVEDAADTITEALDAAKVIEDAIEMGQARSEIAKVHALINTKLAIGTCREIRDRNLRIKTLTQIAKIIKQQDPKTSIKMNKQILRAIDSYGLDESLHFEPLCEKAKALLQSEPKRAKRALARAEEMADDCPHADKEALHLVEIAKVKALVNPVDEHIVLNKIIKLLNEIFDPIDQFSTIWSILRRKEGF